MKSYNIHTFVLSVVTFMMTLMILAGCKGKAMSDDGCKSLLDSAAINMGAMDYASAKKNLAKVLDHGNNKMHEASADLLMMRISIFLAEYKEFYDYRTDCDECMVVLKDAEPYMTDRQKIVWHYLQKTYYKASARYFHIMRMDEEWKGMLDTLDNHPEWNDADSMRFDVLLQPVMLKRSDHLVAVADSLMEQKEYHAALDSLALTLQMINAHHLKYNKGVAKDDTLTLTGEITDLESKEMHWIKNPDIIAIPEWMIHTRERLSMVYAALGDKYASNYNRNLYFDILDVTRQDMQMQQRKERLESAANKLNFYFILLLAVSVFLVLLVFILTRRMKKTSRAKREQLKTCLDICSRMVNGEDVESDIQTLFSHLGGDWKDEAVQKKMNSFEHELYSLIQVMRKWIDQNTELYLSLTERRELVESDIYMAQRRMDENKRQHVERATAISIVQGITPFLDRAIHNVENYNDVDCALLREYVEKINAYNEVLGHWVKVRQGSVILNIENFPLTPLLDTLRKGHRSFDSKNIDLNIADSQAVVKADKALTLFMMNTLLDNARKYTPEGGSVTLTVDETDSYVEVSVIDTGHGLNAEDQDKINNTKVYDSSQIGVENDTDGSVRTNKGFGFGLMNCRGIIEKYRKSGRLFDVCHFAVESKLGEGSRFFFRLPKGVMRTLSMLILLTFSITTHAQWEVTSCLDSIYEANIMGDYQEAIRHATHAIDEFNHIYMQKTKKDSPLMVLNGTDEEYAELQWLADSVDIDYQSIILLRNEVSLAALSLVNRELYEYNNEAFMRLNKRTSLDPDIEDVCRKLAKANADKLLTINLTIFILLIAFVIYLLVYYRHTILPVFNMRQLLEFNRRIFSATNDQLTRLLHEGISSIHPADAIEVQLVNGQTYPHGEGDCRSEVPLNVEFEGEKHNLGRIMVAYHGSQPTQGESLIIAFIAKFMSMHTFFESVKVEEQNNLLELLEDQRFAAEVEQQRLHVQNMVLDNCLSTIKHETMYYPNRILQLLDSGSEADSSEIRDVLKYYREVFGLLSENANRQLSRSIVKLQNVPLRDIASYARKSFEKKNKKLMCPVRFEVTGTTDGSVRADNILLQYLIDTLISPVFESKTEGKVEFNFAKSEGFVKFALSDDRMHLTDEQGANLFYADSMRYDAATDTLQGAEYLIAKQIIREHDERLRHQGCRIYAENDTIIFMLPEA